jgi:hypothetical protein
MDPGAAPEEDAGQDIISPNDPNNDLNNDGKPDTMVPLEAITSHTVQVIEATKGRRTADAAPPKDPNQAAPMDPAGGIGGAPGAAPMPLPGMPPAKMAALDAVVAEIIKDVAAG